MNFRKWIGQRNSGYSSLRQVVENYYQGMGISVPIKNLEVRVAVAQENVPKLIGTGGANAKGLKTTVGCDFLKIIPAPVPGQSFSDDEIEHPEYGDFYRERRPQEHQRWTEDEEHELISSFKKGCSVTKIAEKLQRTPHSIEMRLEKLGMPGQKPGSPAKKESISQGSLIHRSPHHKSYFFVMEDQKRRDMLRYPTF